MHWYGRDPDLTMAIIACIASIVTVGGWIAVRSWVRGLTLIGPWIWCCVPLVSIPGCELLMALGAIGGSESAVEAIRHLAALTLLCPTMSLLGAKRPQDKPWSFIVVACWIVLAIPAWRALLLPQGGSLEIDIFRLGLIAVLMLLSLANYLLVRPIVVFFFLPQLFFLGLPHFADEPRYLGAASFLVAHLILCGAAGLALLGGNQFAPIAIAPADRRAGLNRAWWDFRAMFGTIWALRVADQLNDTFIRNEWDVVLHSDGFVGEPLDPQTEANVQQAVANILRRFVSTEWLAARIMEAEKGRRETDGPP